MLSYSVRLPYEEVCTTESMNTGYIFDNDFLDDYVTSSIELSHMDVYKISDKYYRVYHLYYTSNKAHAGDLVVDNATNIVSTELSTSAGQEITFDPELNLIFKKIENRKIAVYNTSAKLGEITTTDDIQDFLANFVGDNRSALLTGNNTFVQVTKHVTLNGQNQTFKDSDLVIRFSGDLSRVDKVLVNDTELDSSTYTLTKGSTIVTLKKDYLSSLKSGTYTLKATYKDGGYALTNFLISESTTSLVDNPKTGDSIISSIILGSISLMGLLGASIYLKKKRFN